MKEILDHNDVEASESDLKGVCYTGILLVTFLVIIVGSFVYGAIHIVSSFSAGVF